MRPHCVRVSIALCLSFVTQALPGSELAGHVKDYLEARPKVRGSPEERSRKALELVVPIVGRIGKVGTDEALAFLQQEMDTAIPEVAACCPAPILATRSPAAVSMLLRGFPRRDPQVKNAILEALARTSRDLGPSGDEILAIAKAADFDARVRMPPVLGKLDTLPAAKALLALCQTTKSPKGEDRTEAVCASVLEAFGKTKNEAVRTWLADDAFDEAGSDPIRLNILCKAAGNLKLEAARERLQKLVSHSSKRVAGASLDALQKLGVGSSAAEIAASIEKRKGKQDLAFRIQAMDSLAALGTPEALDIVIGYAKGSNEDLRAIAVGSLKRFEKEPRAMEALLQALSDPDGGIRANALWGLAGFRDKAMVGPLIQLLEKDERLRVQALEMLVKLTGQNMDLVAEDWKKWWDVAEPKFQLPDEKAKGTTRVKAKEFSYFGLEVSSKKIAFLVDASTSMREQVAVKLVKGKDSSGEAGSGGTSVGGKGGSGGDRLKTKDGRAMKMDILKRELARVIGTLPGDTQVNIVTFSREFTPWQQQLQPLAGAGRARAIEYVRGIEMRSGTNVFDTLEFALGDKRTDTIYLLSDGEPTAGRFTDIPSITREVQVLNRVRGITIHCIAFGEESKLLEAIAKENGGQYRFVDRVEE
jgi:HEAT repeat protein